MNNLHYPLFAVYVPISVSSAHKMDYIHFENAQSVYRLIRDSLGMFWRGKTKRELRSYRIKIIVVALVCLRLLLSLLCSMLLLIFLFLSWFFFLSCFYFFTNHNDEQDIYRWTSTTCSPFWRCFCLRLYSFCHLLFILLYFWVFNLCIILLSVNPLHIMVSNILFCT